MASPDIVSQKVNAIASWLDQPLSRKRCQIGWLVAIIVFLGLTALIGGPVQGDASVSVYSTWFIAHGHLACAYEIPRVNSLNPLVDPYTRIAPLYPVLTGIVAAILRLGHSVPFPSSAQMGPHCVHGTLAVYHWAVNSNVINPTIRIGYLAWLALMAGVIAILRVSGRGQTRWEPLTLLLVAVVPPVAMCLTEYFHPQDLLAMGLILFGVARAREGKWMWAGIFFGLALATNQFALLAWAALFFGVPKNQRIRFLSWTVVAAAVIDLPFVILTSGRAFGAVVFSSGSLVSPLGGTLVWEAHIRGVALFIVSRVLPPILALGLGWWAARRLGPRILEPVPLMSLIATALTLRLVLESNLWGYYFMPLAVMLIVLDVANHRFRRYVLVWVFVYTVRFNPFPWGFASNGQSWGTNARLDVPLVIAIITLLFVGFDLARRRFNVQLLVWIAIAALMIFKMPWIFDDHRRMFSTYLYQIVLVFGGGALAINPLIAAMRKNRTGSVHVPDPLYSEPVFPPSPSPQLPN